MTTTFDLLAFERGNDANEVLRRGIPEWRLEEAVRWAVREGRNTVLVELTERQASSDRCVTHHVCRDPHCPGGCG